MKRLFACVLILAAAKAAPAVPQDGLFPVEVLGYELSLEVFPTAKTVFGVATVEVLAIENDVTTIPFSLNAGLELESVTEGKAAVPFTEGNRIAEGRAITLTPEPPLKKGKARTFTFTYAGEGVDPGSEDHDWMGILLVRPDEIRMSHQAQWYPIVPRDEKASAKLVAPVELELVLPAGMESLGPGRYGGKKKREGREVHTWSSRTPTRASILAGAYEVQELKAGKRRLRVLSFPDHVEGAKKWAKEAGAALKFLERWMGKPKDVHYGIAEMHVRNRANSYNYEADGFSVYDSVLFDGRDVDPRKVAHEAAHLWWGGLVDPIGPGERFLTESLAEFSALLYLEQVHGEEAGIDARRGRITEYLRAEGEEDSLAEATFSSPRYRPVVYAKGAMALRTLRYWLGEKDFDEGLKLYVKRFRGGKIAARLVDFVDAMRAKAGDDVDAWAEEWLLRKGVPHYAVDFKMAGEIGGNTTVTLTVTQRGDVYTNPVEVEIVQLNGFSELVRVEPREAESSHVVILRDLVEGLVFDPRALVVSGDRK